jgi:hypothetical protein
MKIIILFGDFQKSFLKKKKSIEMLMLFLGAEDQELRIPKWKLLKEENLSLIDPYLYGFLLKIESKSISSFGLQRRGP